MGMNVAVDVDRRPGLPDQRRERSEASMAEIVLIAQTEWW